MNGAAGEETSAPGRSPFLTAPEAAAYCRVSLRTLHERARRREIPHRRLHGTRRLLFVAAELDAWIAGARLEVSEGPGDGRVVKPVGS